MEWVVWTSAVEFVPLRPHWQSNKYNYHYLFIAPPFGLLIIAMIDPFEFMG
jgi:hypothetical protein